MGCPHKGSPPGPNHCLAIPPAWGRPKAILPSGQIVLKNAVGRAPKWCGIMRKILRNYVANSCGKFQKDGKIRISPWTFAITIRKLQFVNGAESVRAQTMWKLCGTTRFCGIVRTAFWASLLPVGLRLRSAIAWGRYDGDITLTGLILGKTSPKNHLTKAFGRKIAPSVSDFWLLLRS